MSAHALTAISLLLYLTLTHAAGESCTTDADCTTPLSCVGGATKRCFMKKPLGMRCGVDPFWTCEDSLICDNNVCKTPVAGACNRPGDCADGLSCLGTSGNKKCMMPKGPGMRCGADPFWTCREDLVCQDRICKTPVAGSCTEPGTICADGLSCLGNGEKKKCFMPKGPGMRCGGDPFWVCRSDLLCQARKCVTPVAGDCTEPGTICADGLSCLGNGEKKKCFMPKGPGMRCGADPFWVCAARLTCSDGVCKKTVGRGKRCGRKRVCKDRFVCAGPRRGRRCVVPGVKGRGCGMFDSCRDSVCEDGVCV